MVEDGLQKVVFKSRMRDSVEEWSAHRVGRRWMQCENGVFVCKCFSTIQPSKTDGVDLFVVLENKAPCIVLLFLVFVTEGVLIRAKSSQAQRRERV
jgi:hypothetical protein